jgi:hypothetical protein
MIAKNDLPAFKLIMIDAASSAEFTVYGRVSWDSENNFVFVRLFGRQAVIDFPGKAAVSW